MKSVLRNRFAQGLLLSAWILLFALPAAALDLNQAKSQGLVKENKNGYLVAVEKTDEVNDLVRKVNAGRKAEYQKIAKKRGTTLEAVELLAGQKLVE